ncbi:MAG: MarR family transcriptional regulator [Rhizobiaceae bacterium]|nr:MarR family transcriptional regulator [Rhizobiaceae bacterium]
MASRPPARIDSFRSQTLQLEKAIRRIVRANDVQSRAMAKQCGLTSAQAVVCRGILELGEVTTTALSAYADLSAATVVTILDNLEERGIIERYRSVADRRIVHTRLTEQGQALIAGAPRPLGEVALARLKALDTTGRKALIESAIELANILERDSLRPTVMVARPEAVSAMRSSRPGVQPPDRSRRGGG